MRKIERAFDTEDGAVSFLEGLALTNDSALHPRTLRVEKRLDADFQVMHMFRFVIVLEDEDGRQGDHELLPTHIAAGDWTVLTEVTL